MNCPAGAREATLGCRPLRGRWAPARRYKPPQPPEERVAKRNARKEAPVKYVLATRLTAACRRGNQPLSLLCTPPRPSASHCKPAGTISRRPPYSEGAPHGAPSRQKAIFSLPPGAAHSLFVKNKKRMGGASASHQHGDCPPTKRLAPPGRTHGSAPQLLSGSPIKPGRAPAQKKRRPRTNRGRPFHIRRGRSPIG